MPRDVSRDVCTAKLRGRSVLTQPFTRPSKHCQEQTRARKQTPSAVLLRMARKTARFKRKGEKNLKNNKKNDWCCSKGRAQSARSSSPQHQGAQGCPQLPPKPPTTQPHRG